MDGFLEKMGERLQSRRKQLRMTQEELAEMTSVTSQMISTAELGKKAMRPENIVKICAALEISADYLLTGVITQKDRGLLEDKTTGLSPHQFHCLEEIIKNYISGCSVS